VKKLFLNSPSGDEFAKVMRVLLHYFLKKDSMLFLLTSKKIKRHTVGHHFQAIRNIEKELLDS
jgi:hypothetical protein